MTPAIPYCGPAPQPEAIAAAWNLDPMVLAALALSGWALRRQGTGVRIGLGLLALAYVSPLCGLSAGLFSARTVHHLVIVFGAAPLLAGALKIERVPLVPAFLCHLGAFWLWHLPVAYDLALSHDAAYWAGQIALLASAVLLWRALGQDDQAPTTVFFVIAAMVMQMGMLGAVLTFAPGALYVPHYLTTARYGIGVLADQQMAGLLMWVGSLPLTVAAAWPPLARLAQQARGRLAG
ncbi:cytochrome c oxidase assembly protein [Erythrobacter donghaensis]|jgi:putative membrane protein|uniref:cytochrome c oxidase assembly protein n=1 Tax=Erythrobacter donghaensis TaxID=267135 RepID=UPI00093A3094|nr:cytochrome c oxidase assembly protein [Erythrobacter donghaensis]